MLETTTIWDHSHETLDRDSLRQLQLERLQASLFRAYRNVSYYRKRFDALGIAPEDVTSLAELAVLPFTTDVDLQQGYPYDLLAVPLREVVRLHSASWSTGRPTVCAYTRNDLRHWNDLTARVLTAGGVTRDDVVQIFFDYGLLTDSIGFHGGAERIGASVIPVTAESIERQLAVIQDFKTTVIVGGVGDAAQLAALIDSGRMDMRRLSLRVGVFGAQPWSDTLRAHVEQSLGLTALDTYTLAALGGPGIAGECVHKCGLHLAEDHFFAEIVDPQTGACLADGDEGELVITTLTREALPLIRYRTGDITRLTNALCACGRTLARIERLRRRTDDLLIVAGKKLYPAQVEAILTEVEGSLPQYQLVIDRKQGLEEVELVVELLSNLSPDSLSKVLAAEHRIAERLYAVTGLSPKVRMVESATMEKLTEGKTARIDDRRE